MKMKQRIIFVGLCFGLAYSGLAQNHSASYDDFFKNAKSDFEKHNAISKESYNSFRDKANALFVEALKNAWADYNALSPLPKPNDEQPIPTEPYISPIDHKPIEATPRVIPRPNSTPAPQPLEPIEEVVEESTGFIDFTVWGINEKIRAPKSVKVQNKLVNPNQIASEWKNLAGKETNNLIIDCLVIKNKYGLCDWAYLQMLDKLSKLIYDNDSYATLLTAYLLSQSGYQMRLGLDNGRLCLLYGSRHQIFDKPFFAIGESYFYPLDATSNALQICDAPFVGEQPLSLYITKEQNLGSQYSSPRQIKSRGFSDLNVSITVSSDLISFYNDYPSSMVNNNPMTRWAIYAETPIENGVKEKLYPTLKRCVAGCDELTAANKLLNWVQTGFAYEYDDKVWGHDRAFFAEETLYYPYCDCEDRSILFSRLVRDILGLDVALIYYPGHLATAVCFNGNVRGDAMIIDGRKFIVCDPTYIGAPVGVQMPDLKYDQAEAIILKR